MRAVGLLCGAGSILHEARHLGCKIVGNVETRRYFRTAPWAWDANFHGIQTTFDPSALPDALMEADLAFGHPPCGRQSTLGQVASRDLPEHIREARETKRRKDPGLLPLFTDLVRRTKPKMFALDNLPKILHTVTPEAWWRKELPGYKLTFIIITNFDYGSCQRRVRLWVIGSRGKPFHFKPTSKRIEGPRTAWEAISDLPWEPWINIPEIIHVHRDPNYKPEGSYWDTELRRGKRYQLQYTHELARAFLSIPMEHIMIYRTASGRIAHKIGRLRCSLYNTSRVVSGLETLHHPLSGWPFTMRERARIMGWPDDFQLTDGNVELNRSNLYKLLRVTGKGVPSEFPRYLIPQMQAHLRRM